MLVDAQGPGGALAADGQNVLNRAAGGAPPHAYRAVVVRGRQGAAVRQVGGRLDAGLMRADRQRVGVVAGVPDLRRAVAASGEQVAAVG